MTSLTISQQKAVSGYLMLPESFQEKLIETKVGQVIPRSPSLIIARTTDTVAQVFSRLIENGILSVPLLHTGRNRYIAFLDIFEILAFVMRSINIDAPEEEVDEKIQHLFASTPCTDLIGCVSRAWWNLVGEDAPIQAAINELRFVRRLAVIDHHATMFSVLTQTKVARWLAKRTDDELGALGHIPIADIKLGFGEVVVANQHEKVIRVFARMYEFDVSGVAIENDEGAVIGNISISDLKDIGYTANMFSRLSMTCEEFLEKKVEGLLVPHLVSATPNTTVRELLQMFREHHVHRVYILSAESKAPLGVCTLTDIMNLFSVPPPEQKHHEES